MPGGLEAKLWAAADKLRGHIDAAEYKHVALGLIFLKYISDAFQELHDYLSQEQYADPEDRDEYLAGFCKSATFDEIAGHDHVLTPGRYVGVPDIEDDGEPFEEKMERLTATLQEQFAESVRLEQVIRQNLSRLGYDG